MIGAELRNPWKSTLSMVFLTLPHRAMLLASLLVAGGLASGTPVVRAEADAPAQIILRGGTPDAKVDDPKGEVMTPSAAFELRCADPMVGAERVGSVEPESPIVLAPPLPGSFRWTSQRGGVFTLSAPPALGTVYHVSVRPGLFKANGEPLGADEVRATYHTPPMEALAGESSDKKDLPSTPKVQLLFKRSGRSRQNHALPEIPGRRGTNGRRPGRRAQQA